MYFSTSFCPAAFSILLTTPPFHTVYSFSHLCSFSFAFFCFFHLLNSFFFPNVIRGCNPKCHPIYFQWFLPIIYHWLLRLCPQILKLFMFYWTLKFSPRVFFLKYLSPFWFPYVGFPTPSVGWGSSDRGNQRVSVSVVYWAENLGQLPVEWGQETEENLPAICFRKYSSAHPALHFLQLRRKEKFYRFIWLVIFNPLPHFDSDTIMWETNLWILAFELLLKSINFQWSTKLKSAYKLYI